MQWAVERNALVQISEIFGRQFVDVFSRLHEAQFWGPLDLNHT